MAKIIYNSFVLDDKWNDTEKHYDFVFIAIGSDFRAYEAIKTAKANQIAIDNLILFEFHERVNDVEIRKGKGSQEYKNIEYHQTFIRCSIKDPSDALRNFQLNSRITSSSRVAVDITVFTKPFFFTLLHWLKVIHKVEDLTIFYTEPKDYVFDKGLYSAYHSSYGPIRVEEIPSFSGDDSLKEQSLLIIMLGFDGDLSSEINEDVAPKKTVVVNGFPSYSPNFKDISLISNEKLVNTGGNTLLYSRATNPFDAYNLLEKLRIENKDLFLNIAPIGTKPMALGVCLFAIHYPDVRVIYPTPEKFENITTKDAWNTWVYKINLKK
jgi:hypothetical protein